MGGLVGAPTEVSSLMVWEKELYAGHSHAADTSLAIGHNSEEMMPQVRRVRRSLLPTRGPALGVASDVG
jgi:hypothetical protein